MTGLAPSERVRGELDDQLAGLAASGATWQSAGCKRRRSWLLSPATIAAPTLPRR